MLQSVKLYTERLTLEAEARAATARAVCRHCGLARSTVTHECHGSNGPTAQHVFHLHGLGVPSAPGTESVSGGPTTVSSGFTEGEADTCGTCHSCDTCHSECNLASLHVDGEGESGCD